MANPFDQFDEPAHTPTQGGPITLGSRKPEIRQVGSQLGVVNPQTGQFTPTYTAPEKPEGSDPKLTQDERTAAFLATRVAGGIKDIASVLKDNPDAAKPEIDAAIAGSLPLVGGAARNLFNSTPRQRIEAAQLDVLDAALTLGTGAAYSKEQLAGYAQSYFPQIGDSEDTIKDKRARLNRLLESARVKAGGAGSLIEEALAAANGGKVDDQTGGGNVQFNDQRPDLTAPRMTPEQQAAYDALVASGATADQLRAFGQRINMRIDNADAVVDARNKGAGFVPSDQAVYDESAYRQQLDQSLQQQGFDPSVAVPFERGITAGLADELRGIGAAGRALVSNQPVLDAYTQGRDEHRRAVELSYGDNPLGSGLAELGGGALIPGGSAGGGIRGLAKTGAIQGGISGFGYGDGASGSLAGLALGAPLGAGVGAGVGAATSRLSQLAGNTGNVREVADAAPLIAAGERQGIPIRQPDARPSVRGDFAGVEASQTGNPIVTRTLQADETAVQNRVHEVGGQGNALDDYALGQRVQAGGDKYLAKTRAQANALYSRAEQSAGNAQGEATSAIQKIDEHIVDLKATGENTNSGAIKYLNDLRADLQGGASIAKLRNIRSNVRGQVSERNLTQTDTERRVGEVLGALSQDVERILPQQARGAFKNADNFYRQRMEFKDQVVRRFIGAKNDPIAPETAASRFKSFMKSKDYGRFSRMMDELDPADRADIAATVAEHLGKGRNGEFSLAALATNTDPKNFGPKALEKVFGKDGAAAIADLRMIARAKADTAGSLNSSRTGIVNQRMGLKDAMMGIMGGSVAGIPGAIGGMAIRNVSEKIGNRRLANALLSPDFTKWLKNAPNNPAAAKPYIARLSGIAARNAGAAADIKAIQSFLVEAFAQSPGRAAAEQKPDGR